MPKCQTQTVVSAPARTSSAFYAEIQNIFGPVCTLYSTAAQQSFFCYKGVWPNLVFYQFLDIHFVMHFQGQRCMNIKKSALLKYTNYFEAGEGGGEGTRV